MEKKFKEKFSVQSTNQLLEKMSKLGFVLDRILKFNTDFQEFTDVDSSVQIRNFDKFQVHFSEAPHLQPVTTEACQTQPTREPSLQDGLRLLLQKKVPEIFDELQTKGIVTEKTRLRLIKVCISDLVERHGFYPSSTEKVILAKNIITIFPSLKVQVDGRGEGFLDTEFGKMHEGKGDLFLRRWEASIMPKLKAVATKEKGDVASLVERMEEQTDDEKCYTMLVVLTHLLPPVAASRCSVKSAITRLLDFVPAGSTIASLYNASQDPAQSTQPQLVCIGHLRGGSQQYVIVGKSDKIAIPLDEGLACAVDKLFKLYWVCDLAYPTPLSSVFPFEYIYDIYDAMLAMPTL